MSQSATAVFGARRDQAFPTLAEADIDRMRRFGEAGAHAAGEHIVIAGDVAPAFPGNCAKGTIEPERIGRV
jgi:thioredoxin reductase (NADPH)